MKTLKPITLVLLVVIAYLIFKPKPKRTDSKIENQLYNYKGQEGVVFGLPRITLQASQTRTLYR